MITLTKSLAWRGRFNHGRMGKGHWGTLKKQRVHVQHLLQYERIEVNSEIAKSTMKTTDQLLVICRKGKPLEKLPPKYVTRNHELPHDSMNFFPGSMQFKLGGEPWVYDHVFESDRRFAKTTDEKSQSSDQYTRDMLDWWTEGEHQDLLQEKIYNTLLPRYA